MKVGDLVYDHGLGRSAIVLEVLKERPSEIHEAFVARHHGPVCYYRVLYDDGIIDSICDYEVEPISEDG